MNQIFLFTGENEFALRSEALRWSKEFKEKHGEENFRHVSSVGMSLPDLLNEVAIAPFIAERRLVIVEKVPSFSKGEGKSGKGDMRQIPDAMHPNVVLLFVDPKPDRRLVTTKDLLEIATVRDFPALKGNELRLWIHSTLQSEGALIEEEALSFLLEIAGEDQQVLSNELKKLALFAVGRPISKADVSELTFPSAERSVWRMMDDLGEGKVEEALQFTVELLRSGESPHSLWNRLLWMVTNLVDVTAALGEGNASLDAIMRATGMKFGTVRSLLPLARKCRGQPLRHIVDRLSAMEVDVKTGAYRTSSDAEEEMEVLIDSCLLSFLECRAG